MPGRALVIRGCLGLASSPSNIEQDPTMSYAIPVTRRLAAPNTALVATALAATLALGLYAAPARAADTPEPVAVDAAFQPAAQAALLLRTSLPEVLKGVKRVAVPLFTVDFITADSEKAETSGFGSAGRATAIAAYRLKGVGQADFQALTDAAHAAFLADLQAAGFEVVPLAAVQSQALYRKLVAGGRPSPDLRSDGIVLAPAGMGIYGFSEAAAGGDKPGLFSGFAAMGSALSAVGGAMDTVELGKALDAAVLEVQLRVHFVRLVNENRGFLGRMSGTASIDAKVYPSITSATWTVQSSTRGTLTLKQPLALDGAAFTEVRNAPTTAGDVGAGLLVGLMTLAGKASGAIGVDDKEAVADPARYATTVGQGLASANRLFVARLRAGQ